MGHYTLKRSTGALQSSPVVFFFFFPLRDDFVLFNSVQEGAVGAAQDFCVGAPVEHFLHQNLPGEWHRGEQGTFLSLILDTP